MKIIISQENSSPIEIEFGERSQEKLPIVTWLEEVKAYISSKKNNDKAKKIVENNKAALDKFNKDVEKVIQSINEEIVNNALKLNHDSEYDDWFDDLSAVTELISSISTKNYECEYEMWFAIHDGHKRIKNLKLINDEKFKPTVSSNLIKNVWIKYKDTEPQERYDLVYYNVHFEYDINAIISKYNLKLD